MKKPPDEKWEKFFDDLENAAKKKPFLDSEEMEALLKQGAGLAAIFMAAAKTPEVQVIKVAAASFFADFGKCIEKLSQFSTRLDIEAIREMEAAGISQENAVALRTNSSFNLLACLQRVQMPKQLKK